MSSEHFNHTARILSYLKDNSPRYNEKKYPENDDAKFYFSIKPAEPLQCKAQQEDSKRKDYRNEYENRSPGRTFQHCEKETNHYRQASFNQAKKIAGDFEDRSKQDQRRFVDVEAESQRQTQARSYTKSFANTARPAHSRENRKKEEINPFENAIFSQTVRNLRDPQEPPETKQYSPSFSKYKKTFFEGHFEFEKYRRAENHGAIDLQFQQQEQKVHSRRVSDMQYKKFYYPMYNNKGTRRDDSSMISSKSYEMGEGKENMDSDPNEFGRTFTQFSQVTNGGRPSLAPSMKHEECSSRNNNLFFDFAAAQKSPVRDVNYGGNDERRSYLRGTPEHVINQRQMSPNPTSNAQGNPALERSDVSIRSRISNNNSYITRRDLSAQIKGVACDSRLRNMSRTWVKSNLLMDSREDISTIKYRGISSKKTDRSSSTNLISARKPVLEIDHLFEDTAYESTHCESKAQEYELHKSIGQGAYAKVYKATHLPSGSAVAIKLYEKSKLNDKLRQKSIKREIKILSRVRHPNIVNYIDCFSTKNHIYLVMELVDGCSLYELLKKQTQRKISEENARKIIKQVLKALYYCHSRNVTHRDIKLENVIVSDDFKVKLIDFGFSTCIPVEKRVRMFCGTPSYMAPEIVKKIEYCGPPVDIWATGVLFYVLLSGKFPFRGSTDKKLYYRISYADIKFNSDIRSTVCDLISSMMGKEADTRPIAKTVMRFNNDKLLKDYFKGKRLPSSGERLPELEPDQAVLRDVTRQQNLPSTSRGATGTNQFNTLLARLDKEHRERRDRLESAKNTVKLTDRQRLISKYLEKSPRTTRVVDQGKTPGRVSNRPSYLNQEKERDKSMTDRPFGGYFKGDFAKLLEKGKAPY